VKPKLGFAATVGAVAVALALGLAACGGNDDSDGVASLSDTTSQGGSGGSQGSSGGSASREEWEQAQLDYAKCMRQHGVDFPDPKNGEFQLKTKRRDARKTDEAQRACAPILEKARPPQLSEEQQAQVREAALAFARCMREHGVDMPDPEFRDGGGMLMRMPPGAENDPQLEEAQKACQPIMENAKPDRPAGKGGAS
jgi:hypothetical protein